MQKDQPNNINSIIIQRAATTTKNVKKLIEDKKVCAKKRSGNWKEREREREQNSEINNKMFVCVEENKLKI